MGLADVSNHSRRCARTRHGCVGRRAGQHRDIENEGQWRRRACAHAHGLSRARTRWSLYVNNATARSGDEVTTKSKVETDVDNHGKDVKTKSRAEVEHEDGRHAGIAGLKASYELSPRQGVELASHVGEQVWSPQSRSTRRRGRRRQGEDRRGDQG